MKKTAIILCFTFLLPGFVFSQKMDGRCHSLIRLGSTTIHIRNNFITDTGRKFAPDYIQPPFSEEVYFVTGPKLEVSIISMDSTEHFVGFASGILIDSLQSDKELFPLQNLQIRITQNDKQEAIWKELSSFPISYLDTSEAITKTRKPNYILVADTIQVNETRLLEIRSRQKPDLIFRMRFVRTSLPVMPYLAMMMHDSSAATSETEFIKNAVEEGNKQFKSINSFYKDWPSKFGAGHTSSQQYFPSSKLAFYFRKYNDAYADTSLEYALQTDEGKDTLWRNSGHLILLTKLESNQHYTLLVRYKNAPDNIWQTRFFVAPAWYQSASFRYGSFILGSCILGAVVVLFLTIRNVRKERSKNEKLFLEQKALRAQLNPHFVFNALSSIQNLMNRGNIDEANYYFTQFSSLLRDSLHNNENDMLPLQKELEITEQYIKLEQLRFHFQYRIVVDGDINTSTVEVPSLLLQPLVENAVKHGVSGFEEKGIIQLSISLSEKDVAIRISDNGKGFSVTENKGYGLPLTKNRIYLFNQNHKEQKIKLLIDSSTSGTTVILQLTNWL